MKTAKSQVGTPSTASHENPKADAVTEFLILPDGRLLVHNLTPTMAALLSELNPDDKVMMKRNTQNR